MPSIFFHKDEPRIDVWRIRYFIRFKDFCNLLFDGQGPFTKDAEVCTGGQRNISPHYDQPTTIWHLTFNFTRCVFSVGLLIHPLTLVGTMEIESGLVFKQDTSPLAKWPMDKGYRCTMIFREKWPSSRPLWPKPVYAKPSENRISTYTFSMYCANCFWRFLAAMKMLPHCEQPYKSAFTRYCRAWSALPLSSTVFVGLLAPMYDSSDTCMFNVEPTSKVTMAVALCCNVTICTH